MKPDSSHDRKSTDHTEDHKSPMDKVGDKAKEILGDTKNHDTDIEKPFQDTPDAGTGDVPQNDKVIKDHSTGEETFVKNTGKRY